MVMIGKSLTYTFQGYTPLISRARQEIRRKAGDNENHEALFYAQRVICLPSSTWIQPARIRIYYKARADWIWI
jgi:hypothetical protein